MQVTNLKKPLQGITNEEYNVLDMHSFMNILNIINMQISLLIVDISDTDPLDKILEATELLAEKIRERDRSAFQIDNLIDYQNSVWEALDQIDLSVKTMPHNILNETREILSEVFRVMEVRAEEFNRRLDEPDYWEQFTIDEFKTDFRNFFHAIEKNSKGKYRIIDNIAKQEINDYLVQFKVESEENGLIRMPLVFKDVIRDLIANARKYTDPGGQIDIGIYYGRESLKFVVKDNGMGIPECEISRVFEYGYRATNARNKKTMGGGFGLTKALYVTRKFNGEIRIESEVGTGTKVQIEIPVPRKSDEPNRYNGTGYQ
jgi:signal transduction histidine kinase